MKNTEHDISFRKSGKAVEVMIQTNLPQAYTDGSTKQDKICSFAYFCETTVEAELLLRYLKDRHRKMIRSIRMKEFFAGWKHAIAKKHGKKWFSYFADTLANRASNE